jgi:hypothetical protein
MKRCVLALMFASGTALAHDPLPSSQLDLHLFFPKPQGTQAQEPLPGYRLAPHLFFTKPQDKTQRRAFTQDLPQVNAQPQVIFLLEESARVSTCVVPLLVVPVDPNVDPKMKLERVPKENIDNMPVADGLPPCPSQDDATAKVSHSSNRVYRR